MSAVRISLWKPLLQKINLIDTPGVDADADDTAQAVASLEKADFVICNSHEITELEAEVDRFIQFLKDKNAS